jgi:hypothetical protein
MRLSRLPAALAAGALLAGIVSCAATVEGTGTLASDVVTGGPSATSGAPTPDPTTQSPTPEPTTPAPTTDPAVAKQRLLCVLERAAISTVNTQFNKSKDRDQQIRVLRAGASTMRAHVKRSGLPGTDPVRRTGQGVVDQLDKLINGAAKGGSPSTGPYNTATQRFQAACGKVS